MLSIKSPATSVKILKTNQKQQRIYKGRKGIVAPVLAPIMHTGPYTLTSMQTFTI